MNTRPSPSRPRLLPAALGLATTTLLPAQPGSASPSPASDEMAILQEFSVAASRTNDSAAAESVP